MCVYGVRLLELCEVKLTSCVCAAQMSKNMDPAMMQQAQAMMSNPAMAQQAMNQMENMSGDDLKSRLNQASAAMPAAAPMAAAVALAAVAQPAWSRRQNEAIHTAPII